MTREAFNEFIEKEMTVHPDIFCKLSIADARRITILYKQLAVVSKTTENRQMYKFEQLLRTKPRKLLLVNSGSYT